MMLLLCQTERVKHPPINYILLVFFTLAWSVFVSSFTKDYNPQKVLICTALVASMTFGLSMIGFCLQNEMFWCFGIIATLIFAMIPMGFFLFAFPELWLTSLFGFLGTISVSVYIILDTLSILQRLGTDMYVIASLYLYTDIIALFLYVLALFGADG
jgi:FtsH-binding integral membrane protein